MSDLRSQYIEQVFAPPSEVIRSVEERLKRDDKWGINLSAGEVAMLSWVLRLSGAKRVLEVGTLYAYTAIWLAESLGDDSHVTTIEFNSENAKVAGELISQSGRSDQIRLIEGDAQEKLSELSGPFDAVFIDANKGGYPDYLEEAFRLVGPGGLIIGDNTFLFGHVYGDPFSHEDTKSGPIAKMKAFNETLARHPDFDTIIIPTEQGMTVGLKRG